MSEHTVQIPIKKGLLEGELEIPDGAQGHVQGIVLFAHGSGSSRFSPRNQFVAKLLRDHNLATLLIDLLTPDEERVDEYSREFRFDIGLLTERLLDVTDWLAKEGRTKAMKIGYFGSSTGAAAALMAAAQKGSAISAVVSRGGRPDLAMPSLAKVVAPTLLIVGGNDGVVIGLNEAADAALRCEKKLLIIPHATHLFEEAGTLEAAASAACTWFIDHLNAD